MTPLELALKYMEIFYSGENINGLKSLLADGLSFNGPFYEFTSAEEYLNSLMADPPENVGYKIIGAFETDTAACVVYQFLKPGVSTPMVQTFQVCDGKIANILLIFDTGAFSENRLDDR